MTIISRQPLVSTIYDRLLIEDDTEESVSGSDFHLLAILALYDVLRRYALRTLRRWYVTAEVMVLVDVPDRSRNPWRPMPDVYVVLDTADTPRTSLDTRAGEAFPQFICEVASDGTWGQDVGEKQRLYADLGALEYIVFDPTSEFLGQPLRAWRRHPEGDWGPWEPSDEGFLTSAVLDGLRFRAEDALLRVYDPAGERLPTAQELDIMERERVAQLAESERLGREQAARLAEAEGLARERAARLAEAERAMREQAARLAEAEGLAREQADALAREKEQRRALEEQLAHLRERGSAEE